MHLQVYIQIHVNFKQKKRQNPHQSSNPSSSSSKDVNLITFMSKTNWKKMLNLTTTALQLLSFQTFFFYPIWRNSFNQNPKTPTHDLTVFIVDVTSEADDIEILETERAQEFCSVVVFTVDFFDTYVQIYSTDFKPQMQNKKLLKEKKSF